MSMLGDYKSYKNFEPLYSTWKVDREKVDAKRQEYLKQNPTDFDLDDIQRSKTLLRAIDVMDEYSQKRAEDMEVATETVTSNALSILMSIGAVIGTIVGGLKPVKNFFEKFAKGKNFSKNNSMIISGIAGGVLASLAALPLFSWAARAEVSASRKGRFEAMRKDLSNPKTFAVLTPEQESRLNENLLYLSDVKEKKNPLKGFKEGWNTLKEMTIDTKEYILHKTLFEQDLRSDELHFDKELTEKEIEEAKRDQQLLTKIVEKIDIASQDYAENTELAVSSLTTFVMGLGGLFSLGYEKLAAKMKWQRSSVPSIVSFLAMVGVSIFSAGIQKQASRVGRFKAKQELLNNPKQLVYVRDDKTNEITDVEVQMQKKTNILKFLLEARKNNKEFEKWKKTEGASEKRIAKAMENIEITPEQLKDARRLQSNTFMTFNKVDEKSQKYAESLEALGQSIQFPISLIFTSIGAAIGMKQLLKITNNVKKAADIAAPMINYMFTILLSTIPALLINAYVTKEQKKASRVADMLAIKELEDYRHFADYSKYKYQTIEQQPMA